MNDTKEQLEALKDIRSMMEQNSRFLSLSGLSGIWAGFCALCGAAAVYYYLKMCPFSATGGRYYYEQAISTVNWGMDYKRVFVLIAFMVLVTALLGGVYFTTRKARAKGQKIWGNTSRRLLFNLSTPLIAGGLFCAALFRHDLFWLVAPATLLFYGLALVSASRYTLNDIQWLGICEIALGLFGVYLPGFGLELWAVGFGFLHIFYGALMYYKHDR